MMGLRLVIPPQLRNQILVEIHTGHPGIVKSKAIARSYVWWPGLDKDIEEICRTCGPCQSNKPNPAAVDTHPWIPARRPWERIHVDYAGPFEGHMFLVVVDAYAKWPEIVMTSASTTTVTCNVLRGLFARYGLPEVLVSDNGPCFTSAEFSLFIQRYGIRHKFSPPYHPATNGQAERFVRSFKEGMKKESGAMQVRLDKWLLAYRNAPHSLTGVSPASKFLGRALKTRLDLLFPGQAVDKPKFAELKARCFEVGDLVWVRDYMSSDIWKEGKVVEVTGPLTYIVQIPGKGEWKRHIDQMRLRVGGQDSMPDEQDTGKGKWLSPNLIPCTNLYSNEWGSNSTREPANDHANTAEQPSAYGGDNMATKGTMPSSPNAQAQPQSMLTAGKTLSRGEPPVRRSPRIRKAPVRLGL